MRGLSLFLGFLWVLLSSGCSAPPPGQPDKTVAEKGPIWFEEMARESGIDFVCASGHEGRYLFPEIVHGGAALFDMDGDGDLDAYLVQAGSLLRPSPEVSANRLYRNDGSGRFTDVTADSGAGDSGYGMGVTAGDYDNDGDTDLYVTNFGPNALLRNDGDGRFKDVTQEAGVGDPSWGTSAAFLDHDRDGDLDLFITNYVNWSVDNELDCYNSFGVHDYCLPTNYSSPAADTFYRNEGDGRFTDASRSAGFLVAFGNGLGVTTGDFDGDGWVDLFVANDTLMNQLWINQGGEGFVDEALTRGCALDEHGKAKAGMGVCTADPDDDGDLDIIVVNMKKQSDSFYRNEGGYFTDGTAAAGLGMESRTFTRFGVGMADFDNDGHLDLYEANGDVQLSPEPEEADPFAQPNRLYRGLPGGRFETAGTGLGLAGPPRTSRAAAFGDVNNDGGVDVLLVNRDGPAELLINRVPSRGHWISLRLVDANGRDALGASVTVQTAGRTLRRDALTAYSYCAANDPRVHIGLGDETVARQVTVRWVDGVSEVFGDLDGDRVIELHRGSGTVR